MSRQARWAIGLLAGAIAIAWAMIALRPEPEEQEIVASAPLVETASYAVTSGALEILGSGTVQPAEEVTLGAQVSGRLVWVNPSFREGGWVGRGEVLFRIDPADYRNRVQSASADVAAQDVAVLQAQEEMTIARAELDRFASRESSRNALARTIDGNDYAARILPPEGLQALPAREEAVEPNMLATREPQLRSARAAQSRAQAQLADAQLALSRTVVRAPFAGLVRNESVAVGTLVQPGQALGMVVASGSFEVKVSLPAADAALIPGLFSAAGGTMPASVTMDFGGRTWRWEAFVDRADPILDPETRTIDVFLRVPNPLRGGVATGEGEAAAAPPLLVGSYVNASITGAAGRPYAVIPLEALREGNRVWLLVRGKLHMVDVEVIQRTDTLAFVSAEGLGDAGTIVTSVLRTPVEGMALRSEATAGDGAGE